MLKDSGKKLLWIAALCKRSPQKEQWRVSKAQIMMSPSSLDQSWSSGNFRPWGSLKLYLRNHKKKTTFFPELAITWSSPAAIQRKIAQLHHFNHLTQFTSCTKNSQWPWPASPGGCIWTHSSHICGPGRFISPCWLMEKCLFLGQLQPMESLGLGFTHRMTP